MKDQTKHLRLRRLNPIEERKSLGLKPVDINNIARAAARRLPTESWPDVYMKLLAAHYTTPTRSTDDGIECLAFTRKRIHPSYTQFLYWAVKTLASTTP